MRSSCVCQFRRSGKYLALFALTQLWLEVLMRIAAPRIQTRISPSTFPNLIHTPGSQPSARVLGVWDPDKRFDAIHPR